jgi:hypothetical protein
MLSVLSSLLQTMRLSLRSRTALQLEILALRHQLQILQRSRRRRVRLNQADRLLWVWLSRTWNKWRSAASSSDLFSVAVPQPRPLEVPLAYGIAGGDRALAQVVSTWIELKRKDGTTDALFAHWILGQDATPTRQRWSIVHDGQHWL